MSFPLSLYLFRIGNGGNQSEEEKGRRDGTEDKGKSEQNRWVQSQIGKSGRG